MAGPREERLAGLDCVNAVTTLLQRARNAHPTKGAFQAAEVQNWWNTPHPTDTLRQLFWFDDLGRPEAAVVATEFGDGTTLVYDQRPRQTVGVAPLKTAAAIEVSRLAPLSTMATRAPGS